MKDLQMLQDAASRNPGGGVLVEIFGGGVPPASPNPDPISDQKMLFPMPIFRPHQEK